MPSDRYTYLPPIVVTESATYGSPTDPVPLEPGPPAPRLVGTVQLVCRARTDDGAPRLPFFAVAIVGYSGGSVRIQPLSGHGVGTMSARLILTPDERSKYGATELTVIEPDTA